MAGIDPGAGWRPRLRRRKTQHEAALRPYLALIDDFLNGSITAPEFEMAYHRISKNEQHIFGSKIFDVVDRLFGDADAYVAYPELRTETEGLDDSQLRACAARARDQLSGMGFL